MFDEDYYISNNDDIRTAVAKKQISSAGEHYFNTGYFEGRMPSKILVDEKFYLESNPDVAEAIRRGGIQNAQEHFEYSGFREGRLPYKDFSLF
ncbi:hypothetical protein JMJ56_31990 [Belnapia sp. T18]|uniref:Uncharacterized protein n=1 Tax=Belnapia arida TaxID=2804533 RepID=A0ABS1UD42_9PROT|nr:hypothetical protein [Belnapia arida]MBL6082588.1 hypothetical protein [Belnapia arida]